MRPDFSRAGCIGEWQIFDSTDLFDHVLARSICNECPVRLACARRLAEVRNRETEGTWAGQLILPPRKPRKKAA